MHGLKSAILAISFFLQQADQSARVKQYRNSIIRYAYELIGYQTMAEDLEPLRYGMYFHAVIVFVRGL